VASSNPLTKRELDRIRALHGEGKTRNDIAKAVGRSASAITAACNKMGLSFDRTKTAAATKAKVLDARAKRAELMNKLLDDAEKLRQQLWEPTKIYSFGGKDNTYAERKVDRPPFKDQRDIVNAVSTTITASLRLDEHDKGSDVDDSKSMLRGLAEKLKVAWKQHHEQTPDDEQPEAGGAS
jgi:IS30 family transposase